MQQETKFKNKVIACLKELDHIWILKTQMVAIRGVPDLLLCVRGKLVAWELKVGKNKATPLQEYNLKRIRDAGGIAVVVTPDNFDEHFNNLMEGT